LIFSVFKKIFKNYLGPILHFFAPIGAKDGEPENGNILEE
jgi:hypothetical protein